MRDDLSGLRALLCVAEKRGFRAAASALRLTPSAVSQAVRALEERVGVQLVQRTTRSVGLTEAGERFVARVRPAINSIGEAFDALGELREKPAGNLRITIARASYLETLKPRLAAFVRQYPDITLDVRADDELADIVADGFDAGIRLGETVERDMVGVRVSEDQRVAVVASSDYFAKRDKPRQPRELEGHDCINLRLATSGAVYRWEFTDGDRDLEIAVRGPLVTNDSRMVVDAAIDGLGLAYVFESMVREHLAARRLVRVLEDFCPPFPGYFLYYARRADTARLKAFVEHMRHRSEAVRARPAKKSSARKRRR
jgi:DNA-binding transcriptional LysR family regulator